MAEKVIKIQIDNGGKLENFYIKFYVDMIYPCFNKFKTKLVERCPEIEGSKGFSLYWIDEDNDEIIIKNDADLRFYGEQTKAGKVIVRIDKPVEAAAPQKDEEMEFIPTSTASPANETKKNEIHYGIICDGCDGTISGYRYKCMQCPDFDLCMKCENQMIHRSHLMIRISNENMKNLPSKRTCKINLRQFAPRIVKDAGVAADVVMNEAAAGGARQAGVGSSEEDKEKKSSRQRKGEPTLDEKCKHKRYHRSQSKQETKEKKQEEKAKRHQERAQRYRQKYPQGERCGRLNIPHFLSYMMDPANLGTHDIPIDIEEPTANATTQQQQQQQQQSPNTEQPSRKSFSASASANLPGSLGGAAASAHIGCPFSFTGQPMQHLNQLNRTLSNFLNPFGVNVEFGFPNGGPTTTTTTTTTTAHTANGENEKPTQTETRTDENSSQTQHQIQVEKLTQTENLKPEENKETTTTSSSSTTTSFTTANGGNMEGDIPMFVSQNRELFAKIVASAAAGAAANAHEAAHAAAVASDAHEAAHAAGVAAASALHSAQSSLHSAEMAASLASSTAPSVIDVSVPAIGMEPFVVDCDEKSPTESINEVEFNFDESSTSEDDSVSVLSDNTQDNLDDWTYIQQQAAILSDDSHLDESVAPPTGAIPKNVSFSANGDDKEAAPMQQQKFDDSVDFVQLSNDLKRHIEEQLCREFKSNVSTKEAEKPVEGEAAALPIMLPSVTAIPMPAPAVIPGAIPLRQHEKVHIDMAIRTMMAMGFNNEGGWLTRLLETVDGNIPRALEFLQPHQ